MIERRREQKTLRALDELIEHLATLRDERKFVVLLSEGWVLFRQNDRSPPSSSRTRFPARLPASASRTAASRRTRTRRASPTIAASRRASASDRCWRFVDHTIEMRQLAQRANRANVTFYAVDPRGLAAFDDSIGPMRPATPAQDRERMASRQGGLRELAGNTDGAVVLNTNDVKGGVAADDGRPRLVLPDAVLLDESRSSMAASARSRCA